MNDQQIKKGFSNAFVLLCGMALRHSSSRQPNIEKVEFLEYFYEYIE